jgi:hypothetical protein
MRRSMLCAAVTFGVLAITGRAQAQDTTVTGTTTVATPPPPAPPPAPAAPAPAVKAAPAAEPESTTPDHEALIGHFGVGYFGVSQLPIAGGLPGGMGMGGCALARDNVNAPVIGVRYWMSRMIGIDAGVGFGLTSGSTEAVAPGSDTTTDKPSRLGLALHGGVPLAFASGKHYTFTVVPEATAGFTSGTIKGAPGVPDVNLSGFRLDVGARVGAEIYFGFIGIPQLSLQASVGAYFRHEGFKASTDTAAGPVSASDSTNTFTTSVNADPWALFVNNISAFYYF